MCAGMFECLFSYLKDTQKWKKRKEKGYVFTKCENVEEKELSITNKAGSCLWYFFTK
jgi:hypothetical protein